MALIVGNLLNSATLDLAVIKAPDTDTRNNVMPTGDFAALTLISNPGQSNDVFMTVAPDGSTQTLGIGSGGALTLYAGNISVLAGDVVLGSGGDLIFSTATLSPPASGSHTSTLPAVTGTVLVASSLPGATNRFAISNGTDGDVQFVTATVASALIDHGTLAGLADDDHSQYIYTTPATSSRNVISAATESTGLKVVAGSTIDTAANVFYVTEHGGTTIFSVGVGVSTTGYVWANQPLVLNYANNLRFGSDPTIGTPGEGFIAMAFNSGKTTGSITTSSSSANNGGSINTSGGASGAGGSITTSNGGGSIDTTGSGSIQLGAGTTRTTVQGSASTSAKTQTLPNLTGTQMVVASTTTTANQVVTSTTTAGGYQHVAAGTANQVLGMNSGATGHEYKTFAVGTSGTNFAVAHSANTITFNLPNAGTGITRGVISNGTQTIAGSKTFSNTAGFSADVDVAGNLTTATFEAFNNATVDGDLTVLGSLFVGTISPTDFVSFSRRAISDADYTVTSNDDIIICYTSLTAGRTVTLSSATGTAARFLVIKDESGSAGSHNITIATTGGQTIDGASTKVISTNYGGCLLFNNGANWFTYQKDATGDMLLGTIQEVTANKYFNGSTLRVGTATGSAFTSLSTSSTAGRAVNFPDLSGDVLITAGSQTIGGVKTFSNGTLALEGATSHTATISAINTASNATFTLPNVGSSTILTASTTSTTASQLAMATATAGVIAFNTMSGDATISSSGVVTVSSSIPKVGETSVSISADTNNQALSTTSNVFRFSGSAAGWKITGFANGAAGREVVIVNTGSYDLIIQDQNGSSTSTNQVLCPIGGVDMVLRPGDCWRMVYDNTTQRWRIVAGYEEYLRDRSFIVELNEEFLGDDMGQSGTSTTKVGQNQLFLDMGSSSQVSNGANYVGDQVGGIMLSLNTANASTTEYAAIFIDNWGDLDGATVLECRIKIDTLSNATDEYEFRFGIGQGTYTDVTRSATPNKFTGIRYKRASSVNWQIISRNGGTETATSSSTAVATGWVRLKMILNSAQSSVEGFVNDVSIGTAASNIPDYTGGDTLPLVLTLYRTSGAPSPDYLVDYINLRNIRTARR